MIIKKFKKYSALLVCATLILGLCACGDNEQEKSETSGEPNPIHEVASSDELNKTGGIPLDAPKGASDVVYSIIDSSEEDGAVIEQVSFTLDNNTYCYRAQATDVTDIMITVDGETTEPEKLPEALANCTNVGSALSGMYYDWEATGTTIVSDREAVFGVNDGKEGMIAWLDVVPGIMYSLSMEQNASQELLEATAALSFVEAQGDFDGE